jgi:monoamine oxidase
VPPMRVLVVGAGFAGLTAAHRLQQDGADVTVFEARDRVGGRVWSHRFDDGTIVELGGEWIDSSQPSVRLLAEELGLGMVDTGQDFLTRDLIGHEPIPDEAHRRLVEMLFDAIESTGHEQLDDMTAADLLEMVGEPSVAMTVLRSRLEGTFGLTLDKIAAGELDGEFGLIQATSYLRVEGGNDALAAALASGLDVRTSNPVTRISLSEAKVIEERSGEEHTADRLVVAIPLPLLRRPGLLSDSPDRLEEVLTSLGMGTAAKVAVATLDEPPMFRRQEGSIPAWYWTGAGADGSTRKAVTGFAGTERGVTVLTAEAPTRLARAVPETPLSGAPIVVDWGADPWAGGCYTALGPGQRALLPALEQRWGNAFFAGEHVNGSGTIDGAIRSGETAARRLLETT